MTSSTGPVAHLSRYNDSYETCDQCRAALLIYSDDLIPDQISAHLGIFPTSFIQKDRWSLFGSPDHPSRGRINGWFLETKHEVRSKDLRRHLDYLISRMTLRVERLKSLQAHPGVRMRVNCIWGSKYGDGGPTIWPIHMKAFADMNIELTFDFAYLGEDDQSLSAPTPFLPKDNPEDLPA
jgi:hypothetical protein